MEFPIQDLKIEKDLKMTFEALALEDEKLVKGAYGTIIMLEESREALDEIFSKSSVTQDSSLPPRTIILQRARKRESHRDEPSIGYVQLCYDQRQETIIPMMEVSADGRSKSGRRTTWMTPAAFPPLSRAVSSPTHSSGTVSTLTAPEGLHMSDDEEEDSNFDPIVVGEELHMYLLAESPYDHHTRTVGCSDTLQKFMKSKLLHLKRKHRHRDIGQDSKKVSKRFANYRPMQA
jgi:hypothetical protein